MELEIAPNMLGKLVFKRVTSPMTPIPESLRYIKNIRVDRVPYDF